MPADGRTEDEVRQGDRPIAERIPDLHLAFAQTLATRVERALAQSELAAIGHHVFIGQLRTQRIEHLRIELARRGSAPRRGAGRP